MKPSNLPIQVLRPARGGVRPRAPSPLAHAVVLALALVAAPAAARDACLVGSWSPVGNGAAEWVQRQAPGMRMAVTRQVASLELAADGSYRLQAQVQARASGGSGASARSDGRFSARGRWTGSDGKLTLAPAASDADGHVELSSPGGGGTRFAMPDAPAQATTQDYTCRAGELETRMRIPGIADPIVQRYRRQ